MTFKTIDDDDINYVENFEKNDLIQYFALRQQSTPQTNGVDDDCAEDDLCEDEKQYFFGIY